MSSQIWRDCLSMAGAIVFAHRRTAMIVLLLVVVNGCVTPQYDAQIDKQITQLQTNVDTQFVSLISLDRQIKRLSEASDPGDLKTLTEAKKRASYEASIPFYNKLEVAFIGLETRVDAERTPATPYLRKSIKNLRDNLLEAEGSLQATHQAQDILHEEYLRAAQKFVDAQFGALLTRELALKGGGTSGRVSDSGAQNGANARP